MGNMWIVDLQHYLTPAGNFAPMPIEARRLAEYFASIVLDATSNPYGPESVLCRRRPGRRPCATPIMTLLSSKGEVHWWCTSCHDNGIITGWQNTLWDGSNPGMVS